MKLFGFSENVIVTVDVSPNVILLSDREINVLGGTVSIKKVDEKVSLFGGTELLFVQFVPNFINEC